LVNCLLDDFTNFLSTSFCNNPNRYGLPTNRLLNKRLKIFNTSAIIAFSITVKSRSNLRATIIVNVAWPFQEIMLVVHFGGKFPVGIKYLKLPTLQGSSRFSVGSG
jgi:hypothetical protein